MLTLTRKFGEEYTRMLMHAEVHKNAQRTERKKVQVQLAKSKISGEMNEPARATFGA